MNKVKFNIRPNGVISHIDTEGVEVQIGKARKHHSGIVYGVGYHFTVRSQSVKRLVNMAVIGQQLPDTVREFTADCNGSIDVAE